MKYFYLLFVLMSCNINNHVPKVYFIAPGGDDNAIGSKKEPFATWQKGHDVALPGDTIFLRGGIYKISGDDKNGIVMSGRDGKPDNLIIFWAWKNENPVLDCSGMTTKSAGAAGILIKNSYWHFKGIEVKNVPMNIGTPQGSLGIKGVNCNHNIFELINSHHNAGSGLRLYRGSSYNLILNCDFHHNYDPLTPNDPGGNADGVSIAFTSGNAVGNIFRGCRSWKNSDDGYDFWLAESPITIENCWAFWNGYSSNSNMPIGDGNGFKMGKNKTGPKHIIKRCLAFENRERGFDDNVAHGAHDWINNTAFDNGMNNFNIIQPFEHVLINNLSINSSNDLNEKIIEKNNSWNINISTDSSNFISIDSKGMDGPRQADGSLPNMPFLKLVSNSNLIDKGINSEWVDYYGDAPDLGCFEFK